MRHYITVTVTDSEFGNTYSFELDNIDFRGTNIYGDGVTVSLIYFNSHETKKQDSCL